MTHALLLAASQVTGGISLFGLSIPAVAVIAFVLGLIAGKKWL